MSRASQARTIASPTAPTPSATTTATMVGPEPESVAPYAPACRAALVTSSYPGTSERRNGTWSTSSSPAARSRASACARPWTRAALFAAARTASACGSVAGSAARARFVSTVKSGTANTSASDGCNGSGVTTRPSGPRSTRLAPPKTAGATLSGWPSRSLPSSASPARSSFSSSSAAAAAAPATVAAAEDPSPRATGMSESAASARPAGTSCPARRQAATKPRYSRSASGAVSRVRSVPARSIARGATGLPAAWYPDRAVTRSQRPTATPTQSNPAPRLDVEPATRTVTLARIALRARETEKPAQCHAAGGRLLARSLTWRQYAANHHDHFGCMYVQYSPEASGASRSSDGEDSGRHSRGDGHRRAALPAAARAASPFHRHRS